MQFLQIPDAGGDGPAGGPRSAPALRLCVPPLQSSSGEDVAPAPATEAGPDVYPPQEPLRSKVARWAKRGISIWEQEGCRAAIGSALRKIADQHGTGSFHCASYDEWVARNEPDDKALRLQRRTTFPLQPRISLVTPTCNTPLPFLEAMLQSVLRQTYANWELCIADGGSEGEGLRAFLDAYVQSDSRIKVRYLGTNRGIAENSNEAISLATGDYVAFLDHDDTLAPFALHEIVRAVNRHPGADFMYSDEDKIDAVEGRRRDPHFKPAWSPDLLRACNYITHLTVASRGLLDRVGFFRPGFEGSQDYDLILRATEKARCIVHIAHVLYHWRMHEGSVSSACEAKLYAYESARNALREHLTRRRLAGSVRHGKSLGFYQTTYELPRRPLVSIIICNRDQVDALRRCLRSIWRSDYSPCEVIIVDCHSRDPRTYAYYATLARLANVTVVKFSGDFNYAAAVNFGVGRSRGEVILQLANDTEAINIDWLE
ncbi:MAG: glycosyltransferase family 2 protein, partial [Deltaproteobacteria bacterium]